MNSKLIPVAAAATLALAALAASAPAQAQVLLNMAYAQAGAGSGFDYDAPGFPIVLLHPGSYKLTGNLLVPLETTGIEIAVSGVTLDLNGYSIIGGMASGTCGSNINTAAVTCTGNFGWRGVDIKAPGSTVRNGRIKGFGVGIQAMGGDMIEDVLVEQNFTGVYTPSYRGARTLIRAVRAEDNRDYGFNVRDAQIRDSSSSANGKHGFICYTSVVLDSTAFHNFDTGVYGGGCHIGRTYATLNKVANIDGATSMGGNFNGGVPY